MFDWTNHSIVYFVERQPQTLLSQLSAAQFINLQYMVVFLIMILLIIICAYVFPVHWSESSPAISIFSRVEIINQQRTRLIEVEKDWRQALRSDRKWYVDRIDI